MTEDERTALVRKRLGLGSKTKIEVQKERQVTTNSIIGNMSRMKGAKSDFNPFIKAAKEKRK